MGFNSWRFIVNKTDRSNVSIPVAGEIGAMIIRSPLGTMIPTLINSGDTSRILRLYGTPSVAYPDIFEAIQYNNEAPIWISAPYQSTDKRGGVLVSSIGANAFGALNGLTDAQISSYTFSGSNDYFLVLPLAPCVDYLAVSVTIDLSTKLFTMNLYQTSDNGVTWNLANAYTFSMTLGAKDGFGKSQYITDIFEGNDYITIIPNLSATVNPTSSFVQNTLIPFSGGSRNVSALTITDYQNGWTYFQQYRKYPVDIFMDTTADPGIPSIFENLSEHYQKYSSYILPFPLGTSQTVAPILKASYSINDPNFAFYWNNMKVVDTYHNSSFWTSGIGMIGTKFAQMIDTFNGLAPAYIDADNHGGQLPSGIIDMEYDPSEDDLKALDQAGINPVVFDNTYGAMIVGDKSGQIPSIISDYSYIPHVRVFNYIIENILTKVFPYQTIKLNDTVHRNLAKAGVESIVNPIVASSILSAVLVVCDSSNNGTIQLQNRQFILSVAIQVTPFSEQLVLNFINTPQGTTVQSVL